MRDIYGENNYLAGAFDNPYKSNLYGTDQYTNQYSKYINSTKPENTLDTLEGLKEVANRYGVEEKESRTVNTIETVGRALNWDVANITGIALGMIRDDMTIAEGRKYGVKHNTGWANVVTEIVGKPESTAGKAAIGAVGLAGDIFLSPLTYLTLGYGGAVKGGLKVTSKAGKLIDKGTKELIQSAEQRYLKSHAVQLAEEGMDPVQANRIAQKMAKRDIDYFVNTTLKKGSTKTLSVTDYDKLLERGLSKGTIEDLIQINGKILDEGGIKMFGKTLLSANTLSKTPVGRAANKLGEFELFNTLKNTLGEMFVYAFGKNKDLVKIAEQADIKQSREFSKWVDEINPLFKKMSADSQIEFAEAASGKMKEVVKREEEIQKGIIAEIESKFPEYKGKLGDKAYVRKVYEDLDDETQKQFEKTAKELEAITSSYFKKRENAVIKSGGYTTSEAAPNKLDELIFAVDSQRAVLKGMVDTGEVEGKKKIISKKSTFAEITDAERKTAASNLIKREIERKFDELTKLKNQIEKARKNFNELGDTKDAVAKQRIKDSKNIETINIPEDDIINQAKRYKTAEEFVEAQGTPYYHGTGEEFDNFDLAKSGQSGFYFTRQKDEASKFASYKNTGRQIVKEVYLYIKNPAPKEEVIKAFNQANTGNPSKQVREYLIKRGYDGYYGEDTSWITGAKAGTKFAETVAFYPEQIKTRTQLTDIWKNANKITTSAKNNLEDIALHIDNTNKSIDVKKLPKIDQVVLLERKLAKIQSDLSAKDELFKGLLGARRVAKAEQRSQKLMFPNSKVMQEAADKLFNNADSITSRLAKIAGIDEEDMFKFYFPHEFESILTVKKAQAFRHGNPFSSRTENHLKVFKGTGDYIKRPAEAYKKSALEVISSRIRHDSINAVLNAFGETAKGRSSREMESLGFVEFKRTVLGKELKGWIPKELREDIEQLFEPKKSIINDIAKLSGFDWATGLMKSWSTALFPAFQFLNMSSNQLQLLITLGMNTMSPKIQLDATAMAFFNLPENSIFRKVFAGMVDETKFKKQFFETVDGKKISYAEFMDGIKKRTNILDEGIFNDFETAIKTVGSATNWNPASLNFAVTAKAREFGNTMEVQAKIIAIKTGLANGKTWETAIKEAEDTIFNYKKLTPFEREYMRRIIPFYTFARKNFELQMKTLATRPGRIATQFKAVNNINESFSDMTDEEAETGLPNFVLNKLSIRAGISENGKQQVFSGFGLPIEEFLGRFSGEKGFAWSTISNVINQSNPLLKYPIEYISGVDLYKGKPIVEIDNGATFKSMIDAMGGTDSTLGSQLADLLGYHEIKNQPQYINGVEVGTYTKYVANPYALHLFRSLPTARLMSTIERYNKEDTPERTRNIKLITGIEVTEVDRQKQQFFNELKEKKELRTQLERMGILKSKEIFFEPKQ